MAELYANDCQTSLSAMMLVIDTTLTVVSAAGFPVSGNFRIRVDNEIMLVTAVAGTTWTVTRAVEAVGGVTAAAVHSAGATVAHVLTAASIQLSGSGILPSG